MTTTYVPKLTADELVKLTGGELALRYLELTHRHIKNPKAEWLVKLVERTGAEIDRRCALGMFHPKLCGMLRHIKLDDGGIPRCDCEAE